MITVEVWFLDGETFTYTIDRTTREITGIDPNGDLCALIVDEILESDEFIGPQIDEFVGAWGNWDQPINVVAAFYDAADRTGGRVMSWAIDGTDRQDAIDAATVTDEAV